VASVHPSSHPLILSNPAANRVQGTEEIVKKVQLEKAKA